MKDTPLLTIITVVRNAVNEIEATFQSIAALKKPWVEYVVLDGGSTDGTQNIIRKYQHIIDYWHSQADAGIYDAMNQAAALARGNYVLNINAGDELLHLPYEALCQARDCGTDLLAGRVVTDTREYLSPKWEAALKVHNTLPHQGGFYRRLLLLTYPYDLSFRVFADYDLNQRLYKAQIKVAIISDVIAFHSMQGVSNSSSNAAELFHVIEKNFGTWYRWHAWLHFKWMGIKHKLSL